MSDPNIPVIVVSHLPSAASFYAAIAQPLGLQYLSASPGALHFGAVSENAGPTCVFTLQQAVAVGVAPPRCHITLLAPSPAALSSFYKKSLLAHSAQTDHSFTESADEILARTKDLDGNMVDALYSSRRRPTIETASSPKEARRVLEWQHEVARSVAASEHSPPRSTVSSSTYREPPAGPSTYRRAESFPPVHEKPHMRLMKRETVTTEHYRRPDEGGVSSGGGGSGGGFNGMKLVGTLLGAAAGAAVAYAMVSSESPPRRASYAAPSTYSIPARSYPRADERPPYVAQYTVAAPSHAPSSHSQRRLDERSHVSQRTGRSEKHSTRERSRSEVGSRYSHERPLTILPAPPRSHVSVSQASHRSHHSDGRAVTAYHASAKDGESQSYVSARTHASKRSGKSDVKYIASKAPSSATTVRVVPQFQREERSVVSARNVPLPMSRVGGYAASVAPSDSVSSVGTKRERERLRDRLRDRYEY